MKTTPGEKYRRFFFSLFYGFIDGPIGIEIRYSWSGGRNLSDEPKQSWFWVKIKFDFFLACSPAVRWPVVIETAHLEMDGHVGFDETR